MPAPTSHTYDKDGNIRLLTAYEMQRLENQEVERGLEKQAAKFRRYIQTIENEVYNPPSRSYEYRPMSPAPSPPPPFAPPSALTPPGIR